MSLFPVRSVDLFCAVIDNFGDIGVCWRLARQLQHEHGLAVRLWVDDLATFARLAPGLDPARTVQRVEGVTLQHWTGHATDGVPPHDLVIEGFGCRLPDPFLDAMAARTPPCRWLNLEYLSAEAWTLDCHGLASPHPRLPLRQYFYFPGFDARSGGLLRERGLLAARDRLQADPAAQQAFWTGLGCPDALTADARLSLFAYENPATPALLEALAGQTRTAFVAIPEGRALADVARWAGRTLTAGDRISRGALTVAVLPFLSPEDYDRLLWACDLNLVRGEDSFVRAHWAGRPLLWHIYPQADAAHWPKLDAWLALLADRLPPGYLDAQRAWNRGDPAPAAWSSHVDNLLAAGTAVRLFTGTLEKQRDLATGLIEFCDER